MCIPQLVFLFFTLFLCSWQADAADAFIIEGGYGNQTTKTYNVLDKESSYGGSPVYLRFHFPVYQDALSMATITLSNEYSTVNDSSDSTTIHYIDRSTMGLGTSYSYSFVKIGIEYQQNTFRTSAVGVGSKQVIFPANTFQYYAGLFYRFGTLGVGLQYALKKETFSKDKTLLSEDRPFNENTSYVTLSYHFDGTVGSFLKRLFVK